MARHTQNEGMFHAEAAANLKPLESAKVREHSGQQYTIEGDDATMQNGRFALKRVSDIITLPEGRDWLGGLWRTAAKDLQAVIKTQFDKGM
jgi:hypothetical protein